MAGGARGVGEIDILADGAELHDGLASGVLQEVRQLFDGLPPSAGHRLTSTTSIKHTVTRLGRVAQAYLGDDVRPVRAIAFDKSDASNWVLGWHQDRTIFVKEQCEVPGFAPWSTKHGLVHVEPPFSIIEGMITARIHLDPVNEANAPLKVALGTHRLGKIADGQAEQIVGKHETHVCFAASGDTWFYSTPILHASDRASPGNRRRVLQIDFSAQELPPPLQWGLVN